MGAKLEKAKPAIHRQFVLGHAVAKIIGNPDRNLISTQLRGTPKFDASHDQPPLYAADKRIFKED